MEIHSKNITAYIDYLKRCGYTVTLHGNFVNKSLFLEYNYHQNPYCHYIKTVYGRWNTCIDCQKKVVAKAKNGSFFGCCYAGVGEFVYPVTLDGNVTCFISVSGYHADSTEGKSTNFAVKYCVDSKEISALAERYLSRSVPEKNELDAIIHPLVFMLEAYFSKIRENAGEDVTLYHKMIKYITENCHRKLTMSELSQKFNYSVSTLSHLFLSKSGKSLPRFIDDLRLGEAEWYLSTSNTPITEIALFLGYSSSNYFASAFKKKNGMTPGEYRKANKVN